MVPVRRLVCIAAAAASPLVDEGRTGNLPLPDLVRVGTALYLGVVDVIGEIVVAVRGEIGLRTVALPDPVCQATLPAGWLRDVFAGSRMR